MFIVVPFPSGDSLQFFRSVIQLYDEQWIIQGQDLESVAIKLIDGKETINNWRSQENLVLGLLIVR
jgi:hypothetical protein